MALHLNLYHEIHTQAQQRARDPFKLAGLAGIILVIFLVGYYFIRMGSVETVRKQAVALKGKWRTLQPQEAQAKARYQKLVAQAKVNEVLRQRIENRFYWAPLLARLGETVPPTIQIQQITGTSSSDRAGSGLHTVILKGIAASELPRVFAEEFRLNLKTALSKEYDNVKATFDANSLEETAEKIEFNGASLNTAQFRIRLEFQPRKAAEPTPEATPQATPNAR